MLTHFAVKMRVYLDAEQAQAFTRMAGAVRAVRNAALDQRRWAARPAGVGGVDRRVSYERQAGELAALKAEFPWVAEAPHHCLQQSLKDLQAAYQAFWAGRGGPPKPLKRGVDDRLRFPDPKQFELLGDLATPDAQRRRAQRTAVLKLPKLGRVRCVLHRAIPGLAEGAARLCSLTLARDGAHFTASVLVQREVDEPRDRSAEPVVGIDIGVVNTLALSTGKVYRLPRASAGDLEHLARLQRAVARKKRGSRNRRKAVARLAAFQAHQVRRRRDAIEKVTCEIAKNHGVIAMEDLKVRSMTASAAGTVEEPGRNVAAKSGLNRSMLDVAPGMLRTRLGHKVARGGGVQLLVPAPHTSQRCSLCGHIDAASRIDRNRLRCVACGHEQCADTNAGCNVRDLALGRWGDAGRVRVGASLALLREAGEAVRKRRLARRATRRTAPRQPEHAVAPAGPGTSNMAGGLPATACARVEASPPPQRLRKRAAATQPRGVGSAPSPRSPALQGRE